jgi:hypothetical protein
MLGKLAHYATDALLVSAVLAGIKKSTVSKIIIYIFFKLFGKITRSALFIYCLLLCVFNFY